MKKISFIFSFMFLLIVLFGCQQNGEGEYKENNVSKPNEETMNKETNENYDIAGVITEVNSESKRVLLNLTKRVQEDEEQMWVSVGENTNISNEKEDDFSFEDLKTEFQLKVNLIGGQCLEPKPRICSAGKIVIE